jgi:hypothetical protein
MPAIFKSNEHMQVVTYTGTGSAQTLSCGFKPDLVWIKSRSATTGHKLTDSVRGVTKGLISNTTGAETTDTNGITGFTTTGFTIGSDSNYNTSGATYVAWCWKAGQGITSTNTIGTITSTVSVNASAGFSVVTYTGNGTNPGATIGHGLGVAPSLIITKSRSGTGEWPSYHAALGVTNTLYLNATYASGTYLNRFSAVSSSTFTTGSSGSELNTNGTTYVAYCWTPIAGYSAFGSYTGNGSSDGPFVYTGFRPKFVMMKASSTVANGSWIIKDTGRNTYNVADANLYANLSNAEDTIASVYVDILSNGFKLRGTFNGVNDSGATYVYMAYAENPFKNSMAR